MNPSELIDRVRSRRVLVALLILGVCGVGLVRSSRSRPQSESAPLFAATNSHPITSVVREFVPVRPLAPVLPVTVTPVVKPLPTLQIHVAHSPETNPPAQSVFAPAGRLIRAVTVNTIDSANIDTPIIALVTDSLWFDGEEVIPAGSELHGRASVDRLRDRIVSSGPWTIVWQNGEELTVTGIALDRDDNRTGRSGERDGSAGLTGQILRTDNAAEIKRFAAAFLSGAAGAFQQTQSTLLGTQVLGNARNAALNGSSAVLTGYAQEIAEAIKKDGVYVQVPAGKEMYLNVTHTIDRSQAKIGNLRVDKLAAPTLHSAASGAPK